MTINFFESCIPPKVSHHAKKVVRVGGFVRLADKPELADAISFWHAVLLPHRPPEPTDSACRLVITLTWPWNASDSRKTRAQGHILHTSKPDWDNMGKTITDVMVKCGYLTNDSRIADGRVIKLRGDNPGIHVMLTDEL